MLCVVVISGPETMPPSRRNAIVVVRVNNLPPAEFVIGFRSVEILASDAEETQGVRTNICELPCGVGRPAEAGHTFQDRSEEHTSELQSRENLVCRLLLEKN